MKKLHYVVLAALFMILVAAPGAFAGKGKVELAYVEWSCATASINVVKAVLGYIG